MQFCAVTEAFGRTGSGLRQWAPEQTITWALGRSRASGNISNEDYRDTSQSVVKEIQSICGVKIAYNGNYKTANCNLYWFNHPNPNTLGDANLPHAGISRDAQLSLRMNVAFSWTLGENWQGTEYYPFRVVLLHEWLHLLGLGHDTDVEVPSIVDPNLVDDTNGFYPNDPAKGELQLRYGSPGVEPGNGDPITDTGVCDAMISLCGDPREEFIFGDRLDRFGGLMKNISTFCTYADRLMKLWDCFVNLKPKEQEAKLRIMERAQEREAGKSK